MIIALFPNDDFKESFELAKEIRDFLEKKNVTVVAEEGICEIIQAKSLASIPLSDIDFLVSMGGDGTILRLYNRFMDLRAAIVGINLGHLGFMADIKLEDVFTAFDALLHGNYTIEKRLVLKGESSNGRNFRAVNDIVFHRAANQSLIELAIFVNGIYMNTYIADGIIIATPNGSTAYSLAAGGPIISPDIDAVVITPVCAHTISNRPFVLTTKYDIEIKYLSKYDSIEVRADGIDHYMMNTKETFKIRKSDHMFNLVNLIHNDYYTTLRSKLGWSGAAIKRS